MRKLACAISDMRRRFSVKKLNDGRAMVSEIFGGQVIRQVESTDGIILGLILTGMVVSTKKGRYIWKRRSNV